MRTRRVALFGRLQRDRPPAMLSLQVRERMPLTFRVPPRVGSEPLCCFSMSVLAMDKANGKVLDFANHKHIHHHLAG